MAGGSRAGADQVLAVARELLAIAREQHQALQRGSHAEFEALMPRRVDVTSRLQALSAGSGLAPPQVEQVNTLRAELQTLDEEMDAMLRARMVAVEQSRKGLRRSKKVLDSYALPGASAPLFVDKKR